MDPLVRMMLMSRSQNEAVNTPVNSMGIGAQSEAQRSASGNAFMSEREKLAKAIARVKGRLGKKEKDKKKKGVASIAAKKAAKIVEPQGLESKL